MEKPQAKRNQLVPLFFAFSFGMIFSNLLAWQSQQRADPPEYQLAYRGIDKKMEELPDHIASRLKLEERAFLEQKEQLLNDAGLQFYLHDFAARKQLDIDTAAEQLFHIAPVTEEDLSQYFNRHKETINKPFFEVKQAMTRAIENERALQRRASILKELTETGDLILYLR